MQIWEQVLLDAFEVSTRGPRCPRPLVVPGPSAGQAEMEEPAQIYRDAASLLLGGLVGGAAVPGSLLPIWGYGSAAALLCSFPGITSRGQLGLLVLGQWLLCKNF